MVSRDEAQFVLERCRSDQGVGKANTELSRDAASAFGYSAVNVEFSERSEELAREVSGGVAGEQFGAGDDRVVQSMAAGLEGDSAAEMVDEDVRVDEEVSHAATRRAMVR